MKLLAATPLPYYPNAANHRAAASTALRTSGRAAANPSPAQRPASAPFPRPALRLASLPPLIGQWLGIRARAHPCLIGVGLGRWRHGEHLAGGVGLGTPPLRCLLLPPPVPRFHLVFIFPHHPPLRRPLYPSCKDPRETIELVTMVNIKTVQTTAHGKLLLRPTGAVATSAIRPLGKLGELTFCLLQRVRSRERMFKQFHLPFPGSQSSPSPSSPSSSSSLPIVCYASFPLSRHQMPSESLL